MKSAAAIVCGLMLVLAQIFAAQPAPCAGPTKAHSCCACGGKMACCSARQNSSTPVSATVVRTAPQNLISLMPQVFSLLAQLTPQPASVPAIATAFKPAATPIYARDCARLI